jgi:hypothetical protein
MMLMLLAAGYGHAQQYDCNCEVPEDPYEEFLKDQLISVQYQNPVSWYRGEQFFNEWTGGMVTLTDGAVIRNMTIRYDMYLDELLWLRQMDNRTAIMTKAVVGTFTLFDAMGQNRGSFIKKNIPMIGMGRIDAYLQVLVDEETGAAWSLGVTREMGGVGEVSLYAYRNVVRVMDESRFRENTIYFIETEEGLSKVSPRRKSLLNAPGIDKDKMKSILHTNHIRLRNREGYLVEAVVMYNSAQ